MTLDEINRVFINYNKAQEEKHKDMYVMASLISVFIGSLFSEKKNTIPSYEDVFGTTTEEEVVNNKLIKELFMDYASEWNRRRSNNAREYNR